MQSLLFWQPHKSETGEAEAEVKSASNGEKLTRKKLAGVGE
jgi:hypothetical protein